MNRSFLRYRRLLACLGVGVAAFACATPASAQQVIAGKGSVTIDLGVLNQLGQPVSQGYAPNGQAYPGYSQPIYGQPNAPGYLQTYGGLQFPPQQYPASTLLVQPPAGATPYVPSAAMTAPSMPAPASTASTGTAPASASTMTASSGTASSSSTATGTPPPAPSPTPATVPMTTTDTTGAATTSGGASTGTAATATTGGEASGTAASTTAATGTVPSAVPLATTNTTSGGTASTTTAPAATASTAGTTTTGTDNTTAAASATAPAAPATTGSDTGTAAAAASTTGAAATGATATGTSGTAQTASVPPAAATEGQIRITFPADSADIPDSVKAELDALAQKMAGDENIRIQLLAYASGTVEQASRARRMSLSRALAVRSYLIKQGVRSTRMDVRALGNNVEGSPADRVDIISKAQ